MRKVSLLILLLLNVFCYANDYMFKHIEVKDGLSSNQINSIFKDKSGYMWFSTASGLNRYDGRNLKVFRRSAADIVPLVDNFVKKVQEDIDGNLWVETQNGYSIYNTSLESFITTPREVMFNFGINGDPKLVYISSNKDMWIYIADKGLYLIKPEAKLVYSVLLGTADIPKGDVKDIIESGDEVIIVLGNGTLVALNKADAEFRWKEDMIAKKEGKGHDDEFSLFVDKTGNLWTYGPLGLWIYNLEKRAWNNKMKTLVINNEVNNLIHDIAQDNENNVWIGNDKSGITIFNLLNSEITHLKNSPDDERSLRNNNITSFFYDDKGTMWVGTYKTGVSFYNQSAFKFSINHIGDINCIEEDRDGSIWIGTNDAGLIKWNKKSDKLTTYTSGKGNSLSSNTVVSILQDSNNSLWFGTFRGGLNHYENGIFKTYKKDSSNNNSLANDNVWALARDSYGKIWIGTLGGGVQSYDPKSNIFKTYDVKSGKLLSDYISSIFISGDEMIIGTSMGISIMNIKDEKITNLIGTRSGKEDFSNFDVTQVYKDSRGFIWIGTREGLNIYNPKTDELKILTEKDGISSNIISGIVEDSNKNIWITTDDGVTNISLQLDKSSGEYLYSFTIYDDNDGLQNAGFNQRSIKLLNNGYILMGGLYGINYFNPKSIKHNTIAPKIIFTGLSIFNDNIEIGEEYNKKIILHKSLNDSRSITLDYKQNVITINVSTDDNVAPEKIKFNYKLEGFSDEWLTSNSGKITFTNLSAGKYILKVKSVNNDGVVGPESALAITILPPFWLSVWAYIIYGLLFISLVCLIAYAILRSSKNKLRLHKIETEAEKAKELNELKTRFFINLSHELRTPLTMVIAPLDGLIKENSNNNDLHTKLNVIRNNASKLLDQVNQLLDFRKSESTSHQLTLSDGDVILFIKDITEKFKTMAENKRIKLSFFSNVNSLNISFDCDKMEKIVNNILSNAIKFTPEGGNIELSLDVNFNDAFQEILQINISDTGIGINDADKEKIFDRFFQVDNPEILTSGNGIGLSIVKDFVELFNGTIQVRDNRPKGTTFLLEIPIKRSNYTANHVEQESNSDNDGIIRAVDSDNDTPYIRTIQEIKAAIAAGKLNGEVSMEEQIEEANLNELGIDTISSIKVQKATVIQLTEEGDNLYHKNIISSDDLPDYELLQNRSRGEDKIVSDITKDLMLDKDGNPKMKIDSRPKAIIVDDDLDFLEFMQETLSSEYNVIIAKNGSKAWTLIKENKPNIIVCDLKMPQMDGKELCRLVKNNRVTAQIPFIILTSASSKENEAEGLIDGADEFITKPFNIEILMLRMKKLIENRHSKFNSYIDPSPSNITITSLDEKLIDKAIKYIEANMSRSDFSVEELSKELGMSRVHLYKKLLAITGKTPIEFIRIIRLKRAAQFLRESQQNVSEIAYHVGFNNPKYFTKYFKEEYGVLPSVYQDNKE